MTKHFETVEDLVEFVVGNPANASRRWRLDSYTRWEWDDPVAGVAWDKERSTVGNVWRGDPGYEEDAEKETQLFDRMPDRHEQTTWSLAESRRYNWNRIDYTLSEQLGEAIGGIWTEKQSLYGSKMERAGRLSIPGMLKRLGMTGLKKQIKDAQTKIDNQMAKNKRNYARKQARELAEKLMALRDKNPEIMWPTISLLGYTLMTLEE